MRDAIFGEGAERMVYRMHRIDTGESIPHPQLVAKESRFVDQIGKNQEFHKVFLQTQSKAQQLANQFNKNVRRVCDLLPGVVPEIHFLKCSVYVVNDLNAKSGKRGILAEKMLDGDRYMKWNNNAGYVAGQTAANNAREGAEAVAAAAPDAPAILGAILEGESGEESSDEEEYGKTGFDHSSCMVGSSDSYGKAVYSVQPEDVPQAFTHFSYVITGRKLMVCDLQGVLLQTNPPVFELTDPVIHYRSRRGRKHVFGRTDKGQRGFGEFFKTHECNDLCRLLGFAQNR
jgi:hypothetical protein